MHPIQALKPLLDQREDFSLYAFAKSEQFNYRTVKQTVQRWGHRTDKEPHGGTAKQIMARLRARLLDDAQAGAATAISPEDCQ
ncbi:hypothetical protein SAMN02949497_4235 [Methylomagnum ishizawai]|uniref:Uncharacterized protein n=1 Tax=Methylomagnum ishizawai TaxID=1760988 RepID=A0A1Y6D9E1_9GAMM|nr:hypothetical protein [Methylomagnum ishizawai]SMF96824.1 hypothetical protein SAMN02949497_4235 [Methylomagnum ishizawai]